jgi:outer membrane protein assembly factor BamB
MNYPTSATVELLKETYPAGTIIECISIDDPYTTVPKGMRGMVMAVDAIGTLDVVWRNGSTLGVAYGADEVKRVAVPMTVDALNEANGDLVWVVPADGVDPNDYHAGKYMVITEEQYLIDVNLMTISFDAINHGKVYVYKKEAK